MVVSVYGKCENHNIIFTRRGATDLWDVDVPFERDGNYVVSLYAVDDAGNEAYYATVLFVVKRFCISVRVLDVDLNAGIHIGFLEPDSGALVCHADVDSDYQMIINYDRFFAVHPKLTQYYINAVKCERCGGV